MTEKGKGSSGAEDRMPQKKTTGGDHRQYRRSKRVRTATRRHTSSQDEQERQKQRLREQSTPRFSVGMIADIQYAPIPDGYSYGGVPRYYRHSLEVARHAAKEFQREKVSLMVNLGDLVDGKCQNIQECGGDPYPYIPHPGLKAANEVLEALSSYRNGPVLHAYGNHCLYNMDRETLQHKLGIPFTKEPCGDLVGYHSHSHCGIRFVTIDSYDIAKMRRCEKTSQKYKQAVEILSKENPNYFENENSPVGMVGLKKRFVAFNGAVGPVQLEWLQETLEEARRLRERVIILSHQPILPGSSSPVCLVWNYRDVLTVLRDYKDVVIASFSGHAHWGGYKRDEKSGIHFRVLEAALENPDPLKTYAILNVHNDFIELKGFGKCESAVYDCDHLVPRQRQQQKQVTQRYETTREINK